jgi:hypothetical protein
MGKTVNGFITDRLSVPVAPRTSKCILVETVGDNKKAAHPAHVVGSGNPRMFWTIALA